MICTESMCKEYGAREVTPPGAVVQLWVGYLEGRPFSCMIYDGRYGENGHMHFPVEAVRDMRKVIL